MALGLFSLIVASNRRSASCTRTTGILGAHSTGKDTCIVCFVLGKPEDAAFHPEGSFAIGSTAVLALCWFEVPKVVS